MLPPWSPVSPRLQRYSLSIVFLLSSQVVSPGLFSFLSDSIKPVALERIQGPDFFPSFLCKAHGTWPQLLFHIQPFLLPHCTPATLTFCPSNTPYFLRASPLLFPLPEIFLPQITERHSVSSRSHRKHHLSERSGLRYLPTPCQHAPHTLVPSLWHRPLIIFYNIYVRNFVYYCERIIVRKTQRTGILSLTCSCAPVWAQQAQL